MNDMNDMKDTNDMPMMPIRLAPGADLRRALEEFVAGQGEGAAFVIAGIGSLLEGRLRFAGESATSTIVGPIEILSVSGSLGASGAHLHMSVADAAGRVWGGHVVYGNTVRTTAEILVARLSGWSLTREHDAQTGFDELVVRRRARVASRESSSRVDRPW